jgi:hypothetical protein
LGFVEILARLVGQLLYPAYLKLHPTATMTKVHFENKGVWTLSRPVTEGFLDEVTVQAKYTDLYILPSLTNAETLLLDQWRC